MRNDQDCAFVINEVLLQPGDGFGVEMVRRFVEQQHVGRLKQKLAERDAATFAAGELRDIGVISGAAQRFHGDVDLAVEIPEVLGVDLILQSGHLVGGFVGIVHRQLVVAIQLALFLRHAEHDIVAHVEALVELRLLREIADLGALGGPGLTGEILVHASHDAHERRFTRAIDADNADLDPGQKAQADVFKAFLAAGIGL